MVTGSVVPVGDFTYIGETNIWGNKVYASGQGVWLFYNAGQQMVEAYTQFPLLPGSWDALKRTTTTTSNTHLCVDNGSFIISSPSGASVIGTTTSIQLSMAAIPSSGLATIGTRQTILAGSVATLQFPQVMVSTDNSIWYSTRIIQKSQAVKGTTYYWHDTRIGRSSGMNVSGAAFTNKDLLGANAGSSANSAAQTGNNDSKIQPLPGGSALVIVRGHFGTTGIYDPGVMRAVLADSGLNLGSPQLIGSQVFSSPATITVEMFDAISDQNNNVHIAWLGSNPYCYYYTNLTYLLLLPAFSAPLQIGSSSTGSLSPPRLTFDSGGQVLRMFTQNLQGLTSGTLHVWSAGSPWSSWSVEGSVFVNPYTNVLSNNVYRETIGVQRFASGTFHLTAAAMASAGSNYAYIQYTNLPAAATGYPYWAISYSVP